MAGWWGSQCPASQRAVPAADPAVLWPCRSYYYNSKTEESVWEKPAMLGWEQVPVDHSEL